MKFSKAQSTVDYGKLPLSFEANEGQADASVRFLSRGEAYSILLKDREADLLLPGARAPRRSKGPRKQGATSAVDMLRMRLIGQSEGFSPTGQAQLPGTVNYMIGKDPAKWHTSVATFKRVSYANVFPGVNLVFYGNQERLEFDFKVAAGAEPRVIRLQFRGAKQLKLDHAGNLIVGGKDGSVALDKPLIYQVINGAKRVPVEGGFQLFSANTVGFRVGAYDRAKPLVIDPVLSYSTYVDFASPSSPTAIAVDAAGELYFTGSAPILPITTPGAFQGSNMTKIRYSAFVAKLNSTGSGLIYSTYLGGSGSDTGSTIAVDAAGDAYVAGQTTSLDFPTSPDAFQSVNTATKSSEAIPYFTGFVAELNSSGTALVYSTYLGGSTGDRLAGIAVDSAGSAYITGSTEDLDFPVTSGVFQPANKTAGGTKYTGFISKLNKTGTGLDYSTYIGGSNQEFMAGIAVDSSGAAYVTGTTQSSDFPTTPGAFQTTFNSANETPFVAKVSSTGTRLVYSTFVGGSFSDIANAVAVDASGNVYLTGSASSSDFPTTPGAFQTSLNGAIESVFVTKLNASGTALLYSTLLSGGSAATTNGPEDFGTGIAVDASGDAFVAGSTNGFQFPTTPGALQTTNLTSINSGNYGAFVTELNSAGTSLLYSTYLSGSGLFDPDGPLYEGISAIALDGAGNPYVAGVTYSNDFPVSSGAFETSPGSIFVTKFDVSLMKQLPVPTVNVTANVNPQAAGLPVVFTAQVMPTSGGGAPTGTVSFSIDEGVNVLAGGGYPAIGQPQTVTLDGSGIATLTTTALGDSAGGGPNTITAYYSGDANNAPASGSTTETITPGSGNLPVVISVTPSANPSPYGSPVTFNISVKDPSGKGVPDGLVHLFDDSFSRGEAILAPSGNASITDDDLTAGVNNLVIWFSTFNGNYASSSIAYVENVTPVGVVPTPVLSPPSGTYPYGQTVSISDAASPNAAIFYSTDGSAPGIRYSGPISLNQSETISAMALENGYANSSTVSVPYEIQAQAPSISPAGGTYSSAQQVTITDSISAVPIYYTTDGTAPTTASTEYNGSITVSANATVKAIASGGGFASSNVASATYVISAPPSDFTLGLSPAALTVSSGGSATTKITITPVNGFNQTVSFACSGLPATVSCSFSPPTLTPGTTSGATTNLTITARSSMAGKMRTRIPLAPITSLAVLFGLFTVRKRRLRVFLAFILSVSALFCSLSACGSSAKGSQDTTPTHSTISVTATSGQLSHSQPLTLTLN